MGYVTPFNILLITVLSMQFATSNGDLTCLLIKYTPCLQAFALEGQKECTGDVTIKCLEAGEASCDVKNSNETKAIVEVLEDTCTKGTEMNKAYLKTRDCVFGQKLAEASGSCITELIDAVKKYKQTGNTDKDQRAMIKIGCKYREDGMQCIRNKVKETCGPEALDFQIKFSDPPQKLEEKVCNSSPAAFGLFWTLLLQAAAVLMSLEYFRLTK